MIRKTAIALTLLTAFGSSAYAAPDQSDGTHDNTSTQPAHPPTDAEHDGGWLDQVGATATDIGDATVDMGSTALDATSDAAANVGDAIVNAGKRHWISPGIQPRRPAMQSPVFLALKVNRRPAWLAKTLAQATHRRGNTAPIPHSRAWARTDHTGTYASTVASALSKA